MKHIPYTCDCCAKETKRATRVHVDNYPSPLLCNECNLKLIGGRDIYLTEEVFFRVTGKRGDFLIIHAFKEQPKLDWFERQRFIDLHNQMSGFPPDNGVHGSY